MQIILTYERFTPARLRKPMLMIGRLQSCVISTGYRVVLLLTVLHLLGPIRLSAEQIHQQSFTRLQQQAEELRAADRLLEAADSYHRALIMRPAWTDGWWQLATVGYDLGNFRMCRDSLNRFLSLRPKSGSAWALRGLSEFELGLTSQSLADLRRADALGVTDENDLQTIAKVHELLLYDLAGDFERAFTIAQYLCNTHSGSPLIFAGTGLTALRIASLPKDVSTDQRDLVYGTGQAVCDASANRSTEAHAKFASLIGEYPRSPQLHYLYGCFLLKDHPDDGLAELIAELSISESHDPAMTQIALEYLRRGQAQDALSYAERAVKIAPGSAKAQYAIGRTLIDLQQLAPGVQHLRRALALAPADRSVLWALASAYAASGNESAAQEIRLRMATLEAR